MNHKTDMQAPTEIYVWFADNKGTERDGERFIRAWTMDPVRADGLRGAIGKAPAVYRAIEASQSAGVAEDLLPNALWTRHGSGIYQWWSYKGYEARKDTADQWVLRKGGEELYRHTYLQVVMAHAEREILAAAPAPVSEPAPDREQATLCEDGGKCGIGGYCGQCEKVRAASDPEQPSERMERQGYSKEWCMKMAALEPEDGPPPAGIDALAASAPALSEPVASVADRRRWEKVLSFAKGIIDRLDTREVMRSSVSGTAYDAAERAVFIRNLATEALAAQQPQAASAPTLGGGDGEVAVRAKTVHRRIDALCEAANTAGADYFDASTSMLIATRDLLTALGFPHRMAVPQPRAAEPKEYGGSCEDCKWSAISGGGLCDGCAQAAEPKGCPRCTSSTAAGCNDIGCGYLDSGSGEPNSAEPKGLTIEQIEKAALDFVKKPGMQGYVEPGDLIDFARALFSKGE